MQPDIFNKPPTDSYFIFDTTTGLYSKGGTGPNWGKSPKIWQGMGPLKLHLQMFIYSDYRTKTFVIRDIYKNSQVYSFEKREVIDFDIMSYLKEKAQEKINSSKYYADYRVEIR